MPNNPSIMEATDRLATVASSLTKFYGLCLKVSKIHSLISLSLPFT